MSAYLCGVWTSKSRFTCNLQYWNHSLNFIKLFKRVCNKDVKQVLHRLVSVWNNFLPFLIPWQHYLQQNSTSDTKACTISWTPCLFLKIPGKALVPRMRRMPNEWRDITKREIGRHSGTFRSKILPQSWSNCSSKGSLCCCPSYFALMRTRAVYFQHSLYLLREKNRTRVSKPKPNTIVWAGL